MPLSRAVRGELERILGPEGLVQSFEGRLTYECDMHTFYKGTPEAVALPRTTNPGDRPRPAVRAREAGGGAAGLGHRAHRRRDGGPHGGVMVSMTRMNDILEIDLPNRCANRASRAHQSVAHERRARPRLLLRTRSLEPDGVLDRRQRSDERGRPALPQVRRHGETTSSGSSSSRAPASCCTSAARCTDRAGYDLTGVTVGSEGTFGLVTAITVRLLHTPEGVKTALAAFGSIEDASEAVLSVIIAAGIVPAALEMLDEAVIRAINEGIGAGYPNGAAAVLLIELDGPIAEIEVQARRVAEICRDRRALDIRVAKTDAETRAALEGTQGGGGRARTHDAETGCSRTPWCRAPSCRRSCARWARSPPATTCSSPNVFHAGDGNLHPLICYDERRPGELDRAVRANEDLLHACIALGGSVTGEHGVGVDKAKNLRSSMRRRT